MQVVLSKPTPDARVEDGEFEENEAWALDIVLSTGEGKPKARPLATVTTVAALEIRLQWSCGGSRQMASELRFQGISSLSQAACVHKQAYMLVPGMLHVSVRRSAWHRWK